MKTRLKAAGFALAGGLLGYLMQPAPRVTAVHGGGLLLTTTRLIEVPVPGPTRTVTVVKWLEREPTPRPTDCLVMRWTR